MVHVTRRERESTGALIRRFTRRVQRAGIILQARKGQFFKTKPNRGERRRTAQRRSEISQEREELWKLGKLDDDQYTPK